MVRIRSESRINDYVELARNNNRYREEVEELLVDFVPSLSLSTTSLHLALSLTCGIQDLRLHLSPHTPSSLFEGLIFPNLTFFDTNLPHDRLVQFLADHPSISHLELGQCGIQGECPLSLLDLESVSILACDATCLPFVARPQIESLTLTLHDLSVRTSKAIGAAPTCPKLERITVDALCYDFGLMPTLAAFAPRVKCLKIMEVRSPTVRSPQPL